MADAKKVIADFTEAYTKAYGKKPKVEAASGWYKVNGEKSVRLAELEKMVKALQKTETKQEKPKATKVTVSAKKASTKAPKKAAPPAKAVKKVKKKAKKKLVKAKPKKASFELITQGIGLKPKAFWQKVVIEKQHRPRHAHRVAANPS